MIANSCVHLGVGLDTGRYGHHVSFLDEDKRTAAKPRHFTESAEGYQLLQASLDGLVKKHGQVHFHIRVDAAGQYAENLLQWLHQLPHNKTISVGQPARNKAYRKCHFDKRKADPVESMACARFAIVERPDPTPHNPPEFQQLRDAVALMEAASKHCTRLINQLHALLARVFPELAVHVKDLSANYVLTLLQRYPTPEKLARAKPESLTNIPHLDQELANTLQVVATQTRGSNRGIVAEQMVRQKVQEIRQQQASIARLAKLIEEAWNALPEGPHRQVLTIKGIGIQTAAALVAKIVSIDRFDTARSLIGYFGVFPEEVDVSGTDREGNPKTGKEIRMSCKGNDLVRRLLYTAAQCAIQWNPPVKAKFAELKSSGKEYNLAVGHCMAKLLRQVFAVWKKDCNFDPECESRHKPISDVASAPVPAENEMTGEEEKKVVGHRIQAVEPQGKVVTTTNPSIPFPDHQANQLPPLDFAQLRQRVPISQVLKFMQWHPHSTSATQWRGYCPLHNEPQNGTRSRTFVVDIGKNVYCCHRCGNQGNVLDLWTAFRSEPILPAAWALIHTFGLEPPLLKEKKDRRDAAATHTAPPFLAPVNKPVDRENTHDIGANPNFKADN